MNFFNAILFKVFYFECTYTLKSFTKFVMFLNINIGEISMKYISLYSIIVIMLLASCTKREGEGGSATIKGVVKVRLCSDDFQTIYSEFPDEDREVFIIYGDEDYYGDKTSTFYNGEYQFSYLRKGKYKVFAYSDDETGQSVSGNKPVFQEIEIDKNGAIVEAPEIIVYDQVSSYEGSSTISGKVFAYDWNAELTILKDSFYLRNEWVHISRKVDNYYFDRIRTYYDGSFVFPSLPIGEYEIYVYGRDLTGQDPQDELPYIVDVNITENKQHIDIGRIDIVY